MTVEEGARYGYRSVLMGSNRTLAPAGSGA